MSAEVEPAANKQAPVVVLGRPGLLRDIVGGLLSDAGLTVAVGDQAELLDDVSQPARTDDAAAPDRVGVLVDPAEECWSSARAMTGGVVFVTSDPEGSPAMIDAIVRGADAIVSADAEPETLLRAIDAVAEGETVLAPMLMRQVVDELRVRVEGTARIPQLTGREHQILASISRGESVKQTANALGISLKTVENLQSRLYRKLDVRNRAQAVAKAHAAGLIEPESA